MALFLLCAPVHTVVSGEALTFERAVDLALKTSYEMKWLEMDIRRQMCWLKAQRARLRTRIDLDLTAPEFNNNLIYEWNGELNRKELVRENDLSLEGRISVVQPVILFGFPTNGDVSLNYSLRREQQFDYNLEYVNKIDLAYNQPLFRPNDLKDDLERAEMDLRENMLRYVRKRVQIRRGIAYDYYRISERIKRGAVLRRKIDILNKLIHLVREVEEESPDLVQVELELANTRETLLDNKIDIRNNKTRLKQELQLPLSDSVMLELDDAVHPLTISLDSAVSLGLNHNPDLQDRRIEERESEMWLERERWSNFIRADLELSYGVDNMESSMNDLWHDYWNTMENNSRIAFWMHVPLWDWGRRRARIRAGEIGLEKTIMESRYHREEIEREVRNTYRDLREYTERSLDMRDNVTRARSMTEQGIDLYKNGIYSVMDLLQMVNRQTDTEFKYIDALIAYKRRLLEISSTTYFDFETGRSLVEQYKKEKCECTAN